MLVKYLITRPSAGIFLNLIPLQSCSEQPRAAPEQPRATPQHSREARAAQSSPRTCRKNPRVCSLESEKIEKKSEGIPFGNLREIEVTSKGSSFGEYGVARRALPENPLIHIFVLSLCRCVVLAKMCYARELFDNAAFGRVIF